MAGCGCGGAIPPMSFSGFSGPDFTAFGTSGIPKEIMGVSRFSSFAQETNTPVQPAGKPSAADKAAEITGNVKGTADAVKGVLGFFKGDTEEQTDPDKKGVPVYVWGILGAIVVLGVALMIKKLA